MKAESQQKKAKKNNITYETLRRFKRGLGENYTLKTLLAISEIYNIDIHIVKGEITYHKNML
jgi:hypothetical protein